MSGTTQQNTNEARNFIVVRLSVQALRVFRFVIVRFIRVLDKPDAGYGLMSNSSKTSNMFKLVFIWHESIEKNLKKHSDRMAAQIKQLSSIDTVTEYFLSR